MTWEDENRKPPLASWGIALGMEGEIKVSVYECGGYWWLHCDPNVFGRLTRLRACNLHAAKSDAIKRLEKMFA